MVIKFGKIGFVPGTVVPVADEPWDAARRKLNEAANAIEVMKQAKYQDHYDDGWTTFVDSLVEFWHRFYEEGKARYPNFPQWVKGRSDLRGRDELLVYLTMARNQNQHSRLYIAWGEPKLWVLPSDGRQTLRGLAIYKDGSYSVDAQNESEAQGGSPISIDSGDPKVPTVVIRGKAFPPPQTHLGERVESIHPLAVANRGWNWYNAVLCDAIEEFVRPEKSVC